MFKKNINSINLKKLSGRTKVFIILKRNYSISRVAVLVGLISLTLNFILIFFKPKNINIKNLFKFFINIQKKLPLLYYIITWFSFLVIFILTGLSGAFVSKTSIFILFNYLKNLYFIKNMNLQQNNKYLLQLIESNIFWFITDLILLGIFFYLIGQEALINVFFFRLLRKTTHLVLLRKLDEASLSYNISLFFFILNYMEKFDGNSVYLTQKKLKKFNQGNYFFFRNFFYGYSIKSKIISSLFLFIIFRIFIMILFN